MSAALLPVLLLASGAAAHAPTACGRAPAGFGRWQDAPPRGIEPLVNTVRVGRDGGLRWNGALLPGGGGRSAYATLGRYLATARQLEPWPATTIVVDRGAPCTAVRRVWALMARRLGCPAHPGQCLQGAVPGRSG